MMPEEQANTIRAVMANIKLPNIPAWAKAVPEERWMSDLMNNIKHQTPLSGHKQATSSQNNTTPQVELQCTNVTSVQSDAVTSESKGAVVSAGTNAQTESFEKFDVNFEAHFPANNVT